MSIPPQVIRVKRKRVEEAPVRFLQFEQEQENQGSSSNWAYQRRDAAQQPAVHALLQGQRPAIHVSTADDVASPRKKRHKESSLQESVGFPNSDVRNRIDGCELQESRRFHISRSPQSESKSPVVRAAISKRAKSTPALFVERDRKKRCHRAGESRTELEAAAQVGGEAATPTDIARQETKEKHLKRPEVAYRINNDSKEGQDGPKQRPLPQSLMNRQPDDMERIAADMNQWVMDEIGANLESMEREKQRRQQWQKLTFRPKVPAQRRHQSNAEPTQASQAEDIIMTEVSDDDWIIDEYVRIPANSVAASVSPADIGILVLDEKDESMLFFGSMNDEDDCEDEDEDDENSRAPFSYSARPVVRVTGEQADNRLRAAENHYTADYPEDDVESDDACGRRPYDYRNGMASNDEEFDQVYGSDVDEADDSLRLGDDEGDEDEARMAQLGASVRRHMALSPGGAMAR